MDAHTRRNTRSINFYLLLAILAAGCMSTGVGEGESSQADIRVTFEWKQASPREGELRATLHAPDGAAEIYSGKYFQITRESRLETLGPLWEPWYPGWVGWRFWGPVPRWSFIRFYTGHVVANLEGPQQRRMRCHFALVDSSAGLKKGGRGECQLPSGEIIRAEFPPT